MNIKMATNSQLSTTESKKTPKLSKQPDQEENHRYGYHMEGGLSAGKGRGRMGEMIQGLRSINW